jgi:photosystem II stability/assembly factor-like uncharacterized protein
LIAGIKQIIASSGRLAAEFDKGASIQRKSFLPLDWYPKIETKAGSPLQKLSRRTWAPRIAPFLFACTFSISLAAQVSPDLLNGLKWRLIGPFRGGRVVAVAGVPGDSTTFYFGSVDGGVWKTSSAGTVWKPVFDGQPDAAIGAVAIASSDNKVIYVGTGESDIRSDLTSGNGVYKSTDGGVTWTHIGLEGTRQISKIVVDANDPNTVYVGALGYAYGANPERGVFKSVDGGKTWKQVLSPGPEIGIADLAISASNPQLLFAMTWNSHRPPWSVYAPFDGPGSGLYRSEDAGNNWTRLTGNGLPDGDWGRSAVAVAVADGGQRVYALVKAKKSGLYRSDDGGKTWTMGSDDPRITSRAWYFGNITVDPNHPDVIYVPNVALYRSADGGKTFSVLRGAPGGDDYHQLWIDPHNSSSMVLGTDQGTTISLDGGQTWSSWYNQPTAQLYHVITDNSFPYIVYGAQQDTGSAAVYSRSNYGSITPRDWFPAGPTESGYMAPDPKNPNIVYSSGTFGTVDRYDRRTGFSQDVTPWPDIPWGADITKFKYRAPWTPPLLFSPTDPGRLFLGTQFVMKTVDGGLHWQVISPDLTGAKSSPEEKASQKPTVENAKQLGYGVVFTIAPSPLNREVIWAGSDTGLIHVTRDGGAHWKDVTPPGLSSWSKISMIEASHFDPAVAYAAVDRSRLNDRAPYVYRTRDYGATWQPVVSGLADPSFLRSVREDSKKKGLLFAGTETGVFVSFDDADHWQPLQLNLPVSSVRDLTIHDDDLVIGTHGRSFWILDDITPLRQTAEAGKASAAWLYVPGAAVRADYDGFSGTPLPPEEPTAENPPNGAVIDYFLKSPAKNVTLEIFDAQKNLVRKFTAEEMPSGGKHNMLPVAERWFPKPAALAKTPGLHRFVWDLSWGSSGGTAADEESDYYNPHGPKAVPGTYEVRLTVDGQAQTQPLKLTMDPRSSATQKTLGQQLQWGKQMYGESVEARRALAEIGSVEKQLATLQEKVGTQNADLKALLTKTDSQITEIVNGKAPAHEGGLQEGTSGIASALRAVQSGDRDVPSQAIEVYKEASATVKARMADWNNFKTTALPVLNQQLKDKNAAPITLSEIEQVVDFLMTR